MGASQKSRIALQANRRRASPITTKRRQVYIGACLGLQVKKAKKKHIALTAHKRRHDRRRTDPLATGHIHHAPRRSAPGWMTNAKDEEGRLLE
jgi:hypothetical protein